MSLIRRVTNKSVGTANANDWLAEGDGLFAAARTMRATWLIKRRRLPESLDAKNHLKSLAWSQIIGMPRASMLLLGYAAEVYLKAGVVKAYIGCREEMLSRDLKQRIGHDLKEAANDVEFPYGVQEGELLVQLRDAILFEARYPLESSEKDFYHQLVNRRTQRTWNPQGFRDLCRLVRRIRAHVSLIDRDHADPSSLHTYHIDTDGYLTFRCNGRLRPRITVRFSSEQCRMGINNFGELRRLISPESYPLIASCWDRAILLEDGKKKTIVIQA